jgi:membrane-bound lytic murein transglycosylase D
MKLRWLLGLWLAGVVPGLAQDDLLGDGLRWARENLDDEVWRALGGADQGKSRQFFETLQQRFHGEHVVDLAALKPTAAALLPLLEGHEETRPYAAWLRTRMDYFDVAEEFQSKLQPPPVEPGQPLKPIPNPRPDAERGAWQRQFQQHPVPKGALAWVARLKPGFLAQRIPPSLAWLAEVESSFDPTAQSPAGATGLFQLMPQTAQSLGLSLRPRDERLDPDKNAAAAAKHLRQLHGQFKDWRLTLAAYNAGEGNLRRVMERYKAKSYDRLATHLPAETQLYVPKFEAVLQKREGLKLSDLPAPNP